MPVHDFEYVNLQMEIGTIAGWGYDAYAQQYKNGRLTKEQRSYLELYVCRRASVLAGGPERGEIAAAVGRFLRHADGHPGQTTWGLAPAGQGSTCSQFLLYHIILCILGQTYVLVHNSAKQAA